MQNGTKHSEHIAHSNAEDVTQHTLHTFEKNAVVQYYLALRRTKRKRERGSLKDDETGNCRCDSRVNNRHYVRVYYTCSYVNDDIIDAKRNK